MNKFEDILKGADLRSIGNANEIVTLIQNQNDFDELFLCLYNTDRKVVMRAADAIEKITLKNPAYLQKHSSEIIRLSQSAINKELKWHLALLLPRMQLNMKEFENVWSLLNAWASNTKDSKIVRVNSIQGLFNLLQNKQDLTEVFNGLLSKISKENIPSLNARIKKIQNRKALLHK